MVVWGKNVNVEILWIILLLILSTCISAKPDSYRVYDLYLQHACF